MDAIVAGGGVGRGDAGRATLRDRGERRGGLSGSGLWRRWGLAERRGEGAGEPFSRDCRARQVPSRPLPAGYPWSGGGGVEKRRLGVKRDDRRTSHGRADGRSMLARYLFDASQGEISVGTNGDIATQMAVVGSKSVCAEFARQEFEREMR